ncbi:MAG: hypothetical protein K8R85_01490 [Bacteroidetes bacterium]|nr:hypothetical protein [Bacteroidota bacterium]
MLEESTNPTETASQFNPFDESSWVENGNDEQTLENTQIIEQVATAATEVKKEEVADTSPDYNSFIKETFGYENVEAAKEDIKRLKETPAKEEVKFANEDSEKLYKAWVEGKQDEVYGYLNNQKKINKLLNSEINEVNAAEIIKLSIQNTNKDLSDDEVEFVFNKKFSIPNKPTQSYDETDEDYEVKVNQWEQQVVTMKKELVIEAKMAKPQIEKLKSELTLPDIQKEQSINQPTQEDLQEAEQYRKSYENALEAEYKTFGGFNVMFKDGDIEIPITYTPTDEEKTLLKTTLVDFDSNQYFGERWFAEDGKPKIHDIMADKYFLENKEKIMQKVANEAANQMRLQMIARTSNVSLNGRTQQQSFNPNGKTELEGLADWAFSS